MDSDNLKHSWLRLVVVWRPFVVLRIEEEQSRFNEWDSLSAIIIVFKELALALWLTKSRVDWSAIPAGTSDLDMLPPAWWKYLLSSDDKFASCKPPKSWYWAFIFQNHCNHRNDHNYDFAHSILEFINIESVDLLVLFSSTTITWQLAFLSRRIEVGQYIARWEKWDIIAYMFRSDVGEEFLAEPKLLQHHET